MEVDEFPFAFFCHESVEEVYYIEGCVFLPSLFFL
jgi:hypothetical protein